MELLDYVFIAFAVILITGSAIIYYGTIKEVSAQKEETKACTCVSECLQDYERYNTSNFFTYYSHKQLYGESRECNSIRDDIKINCCIEVN